MINVDAIILGDDPSQTAPLCNGTAKELIDEIKALRRQNAPINIIFDDPPGPQGGRFIEVERDDGTSIRIGEWIQREDGKWALRISVSDEINVLRETLKPFALLGGPIDSSGTPAFHDLKDDIVIYSNSGQHVTAGDVRKARRMFLQGGKNG